jgi:hypothetical protein
MEAFQFERTSFQIEPFESEKFSIRVTNVHKAINADPRFFRKDTAKLCGDDQFLPRAKPVEHEQA